MNKAISKAIMLRTKLGKKLLRYPTTANQIFYSKQSNICVSLLQKVFCQSQCKKYNKQQNFLTNYKAFSIRENKI